MIKVKHVVVLTFLLGMLLFCGKNPVKPTNEEQAKVAFVSKTDYKLYTQNLDGTNLQRIYLHNIEDNINPDPWSQWLEDSTIFFNLSQLRWSPDGAKLALVVGLYEQSQLVILDLEKGGGKVASSNWYTVSSPDWSLDGTKITYSMSTYYWATFTEIFVTDLETDSLWQITLLSTHLGNIGSARWSTDGKRIFFTHHAHHDSLRNIYAYSFESDSIEIIGTWPHVTAFERNGKRAYGSNSEGQIFRYDLSRNKAEVLSSGSDDFGPRLIDSDRRIIFERGRHPNYSPWLITIKGTDERRLEHSDDISASSVDIYWK